MRYEVKCLKTNKALKRRVHCSRLKHYIQPINASEANQNSRKSAAEAIHNSQQDDEVSKTHLYNYMIIMQDILQEHKNLKVSESSAIHSAVSSTTTCNCKSGCGSKRCSCRKAGNQCSSLCHPRRPCLISSDSVPLQNAKDTTSSHTCTGKFARFSNVKLLLISCYKVTQIWDFLMKKLTWSQTATS